MPDEINKKWFDPRCFWEFKVVKKFPYLEDGAHGLDAHRAILGFSGVTLHQQTLHTHTYALFSSKKRTEPLFSVGCRLSLLNSNYAPSRPTLHWNPFYPFLNLKYFFEKQFQKNKTSWNIRTFDRVINGDILKGTLWFLNY